MKPDGERRTDEEHGDAMSDIPSRSELEGEAADGTPDASMRDLDLFYGRSSAVATTVYARLPRKTVDGAAAGRMIGPFREGVRTLPASFRFDDLGPGETILARCVVPDLAPWTPECPNVYRVDMEWIQRGRPVARVERTWGAARFAVMGQAFRWNGAAYSMLGFAGESPAGDWSPWRTRGAARVVRDPDDCLLDEATRWGVPLVARCGRTGERLAAELRRLARWPSVVLAIVEDWPENAAFQPTRLAPNLVCAAWARSDRPMPSGSAAMVVPTRNASDRRGAGPPQWNGPAVLAHAIGGTGQDTDRAWEACERLSAEGAASGPFAGVLVY
ncbi:MAG: hypothetical protein FJ297_07920 [Planctomycetes bacterium]|nr:hypothetical protein [Planctomycetota bacterium]